MLLEAVDDHADLGGAQEGLGGLHARLQLVEKTYHAAGGVGLSSHLVQVIAVGFDGFFVHVYDVLGVLIFASVISVVVLSRDGG